MKVTITLLESWIKVLKINSMTLIWLKRHRNQRHQIHRHQTKRHQIQRHRIQRHSFEIKLIFDLFIQLIKLNCEKS